jgi:hypothetical protein
MALRTRNGVAIFQQTLLFLHGFTAVDPTFVRTAVGVSVVETPQMTHLAQALHEKQNASDNDGTKNENSNSTHDKNAKPGDDGHVCSSPFWSIIMLTNSQDNLAAMSNASQEERQIVIFNYLKLLKDY